LSPKVITGARDQIDWSRSETARLPGKQVHIGSPHVGCLLLHVYRQQRFREIYALKVTSALMPMASRISCSRAIATVWYSVSSYRLMTCLLTPSLRASSV
jgi:hypothetical protein